MATPLTSFNNSAIYVDTMLPYALLRGIDPVAKSFFDQVEKGACRAYTSVLTFDELAYRFVLALIKERYGGSPLDLLRTDEEKLLGEFAPRVITELRQLYDLPNLFVLDVLVSDLDVMNQAIDQYHIMPRDALHYAAMQRVGCYDLASNDPHFDRIPSIRRFAL